jgi:glycosyltransferase involved in cell wall biosynthesis
MKTECTERTASPTLSCVIPCWNDAEPLESLLPLLIDTLNAATREWEIILVDDGSAEAAAERLRTWAKVPGFRVLQLSRNFGKEAALTAGLQAAGGEVVVMMDADRQHLPNVIPAMIAHWKRGDDMVYAMRAHRQDENVFKRIGTRWFYRLINRADRFEIPAGAGDFRLMDRRVVEVLLALPERNRFMKGLYAWVGFDSVAIPYEPAPRACGRSHYGLLRLIRMSIDGLTAFTNWPLRAVSVMGCVLAIMGFIYGGYLIVSYLMYGNDVSGWTTIVVSLMLFMGMQMIAIGVLGEYISRIFEEVKGRPLYIVKRDSGQGLKTHQPTQPPAHQP